MFINIVLCFNFKICVKRSISIFNFQNLIPVFFCFWGLPQFALHLFFCWQYKLIIVIRHSSGGIIWICLFFDNIGEYIKYSENREKFSSLQKASFLLCMIILGNFCSYFLESQTKFSENESVQLYSRDYSKIKHEKHVINN